MVRYFFPLRSVSFNLMFPGRCYTTCIFCPSPESRPHCVSAPHAGLTPVTSSCTAAQRPADVSVAADGLCCVACHLSDPAGSSWAEADKCEPEAVWSLCDQPVLSVSIRSTNRKSTSERSCSQASDAAARQHAREKDHSTCLCDHFN